MATLQYEATNKAEKQAVCIFTTGLLILASGAAKPQAETEQRTQPQLSVNTVYDADIVTDENATRWVEFLGFVREWRMQRGAASSVAEMTMLPAYQKIIGMGPKVIPLILLELKSEGNRPDHWFWALAAISRENPVPSQSRGKLQEMAKAWIQWGEQAGYV